MCWHPFAVEWGQPHGIFIQAAESRRMRPVVTAVALLVVLAGCGGAISAGGDPPAGLSETQIEDAYTLASSHQQALNETPFHVRIHQEIEDADEGTQYLNRTATATWSADRSRFLFGTTTVADPPDREPMNASMYYYSNGSIAVSHRASVDGEFQTSKVVTMQYSGPAPVSEVAELWYYGPPSATQLVGARLQFVQPGRVVRTEAGYRIDSETVAGTQIEVANLPIENVSSVDFTATLTTQGLVREYEFVARGELNGSDVVYREQFAVTEVGTATVDEPSWFRDTVGS